MNRKNALENAAWKLESELFTLQCRRLEEEYRKRECRTKAVTVFESLFERAKKEQKEVAWLGICCLHTSRVTGSYELLLSLYNKDFYFDSSPIETYWRPPYFFEFFEEDMGLLIKRLKQQFPRIWSYEEEFVRSVCEQYYYAAVSQLCRDLEEEIMGTKGFREAEKAEKFSVFFGRYRGEGEILWQTAEK